MRVQFCTPSYVVNAPHANSKWSVRTRASPTSLRDGSAPSYTAAPRVEEGRGSKGRTAGPRGSPSGAGGRPLQPGHCEVPWGFEDFQIFRHDGHFLIGFSEAHHQAGSGCPLASWLSKCALLVDLKNWGAPFRSGQHGQATITPSRSL